MEWAGFRMAKCWRFEDLKLIILSRFLIPKRLDFTRSKNQSKNEALNYIKWEKKFKKWDYSVSTKIRNKKY